MIKKQMVKLYIEDSGIAPPSSAEVDYKPKVILYDADDKPLQRKVGF